MLSSISPGAVHTKGDRDFVTELDLEIQRTVRLHLQSATPWAGFLGEETEGQATSESDTEYVWTLDPIDGTSNFIHGLPLCAVSLALLHDGKPKIGVIGAPFLGLEYYAGEGMGAFVNDELITTGTAQRLGDAIVSIGDYAVGDRADAANRERFALTRALAESVERVRMFGSAAVDLAWVAEGRTDGCIILSNKPWDMAAGVVIARESGAVVTDSDGREHSAVSRHTVAANPMISSELLRLISRALG
ncbi:inositol monophosphatase family protein [Nocardia jinanensis]|uniref:inositol monophosphatase family protein n=1 Tax=Nocardia jinanensis TaxID=382504 RepID=UPI0035712DD6